MKRNLLTALMLALGLLMFLPQSTSAQKKEKTKKAYEWNWDGKKSGNENFDNYLLAVDTLWTKIKTYHETMDQFTYYEDTLTVDGKYYVVAYMKNSEGSYVTRGTVNWQLVESTTKSAEIVLDATNAGLLTASATMALPNLGLNSFTYAKYLKGGPIVIGKGTKEIRSVWSLRKAQAKRWKAMKADAVDPTTIGLTFTDSQIKLLNKCAFIKEFTETSEEYQVISEIQKAKSEEQLQAERDAFANALADATILPEDSSKSLDDIDESQIDKELPA